MHGELLTGATMRAAEQAAIASGRVSGELLMERAGQGVVQALFDRWPAFRANGHRAAVLCGPGNNGGDGFVIARLLQGWGWAVDLWFSGDAARLPRDAATNYLCWRDLGDCTPFDDSNFSLKADTDLVVDALFGTGLTRPMAGYDTLCHRVAQAGVQVLAVDVPSGLDADSGRVLGDGAVMAADLTVTFHRAKVGHYLARGPDLCGGLVVADIGLGQGPRRGVG